MKFVWAATSRSPPSKKTFNTTSTRPDATNKNINSKANESDEALERQNTELRARIGQLEGDISGYQTKIAKALANLDLFAAKLGTNNEDIGSKNVPNKPTKKESPRLTRRAAKKAKVRLPEYKDSTSVTWLWCLVCKGSKKRGEFTKGALRRHYLKQHKLDFPSNELPTSKSDPRLQTASS